MNHPVRQSGSALIIILVAIALFAGLSWAVSQGSRSSASALTQDQARLAAQEIIAYGDAIANAVQTLKLRGCADTQLNFANTSWIEVDGTTHIHPTGHNPTAASGCGVFVVGEGNVQIKNFPFNYYDSAASGTTNIGSARIRVGSLAGVGVATSNEIYFHVPRLKKDVCMAINNILGVSNMPNDTPTISVIGADYSGALGTSAPYTDIDGMLAGKSTFCMNDGNYKYYRTLVVR